jgi:hypothetical protein
VLSATPFVASTAGVVTLTYGPLMLAAVGFGFKRILARLDRQDANSVDQDKAIGILVSQVAPLHDRLTIAESNVTALDRAQAVLRERIDQYIQWSKEQLASQHRGA